MELQEKEFPRQGKIPWRKEKKVGNASPQQGEIAPSRKETES
jgi:hypothetical protein